MSKPILQQYVDLDSAVTYIKTKYKVDPEVMNNFEDTIVVELDQNVLVYRS